MKIVAKVSNDDPFVIAVMSKDCCNDTTGSITSRLFAGVGIDFTNRRRNKLAGIIKIAQLYPNITTGPDQHHHPTLTMILQTNENMGNCPKYITIRRLVREDKQSIHAITMKKLTTEALDVLRACSTAFLVTRHLNTTDSVTRDLGFNHRGGFPGFIRYYEDHGGAHLVLPDYSGNQFYQTVGNIELDPVAGMVVLDFSASHSLHITGSARNVFNEEAEKIIPRVTFITIITIDEAVLIKRSIQFKLLGNEQYSPYNPPLRFLACETARAFQMNDTTATATLVSIYRNSKSISSFTFRLSASIQLPVGGYIILDFSSLLPRHYQHMNNQQPQSINDDKIRTWTP